MFIKNNRPLAEAAQSAGMSLIEMVVSIAMVAIIAALFIANYRSANKRTDLVMAAQALVADLHLAQNNTLGLVTYNGTVPAGGWGVHFDTAQNSYTMFADLNAPGTSGYLDYDSGEGEVNYGARVTTLPPNIEISELQTPGPELNTQVNVSFLPPDPQTNIYNGAATSSSLLIQLKELRNDSIKTVRVNFLGLAEVID
jgi:prepilin-type N-terminal cleavage/methylation domain-containing protein